MSQQTNEPQGQQPNINPAWKPLLDAIPDAMHGIITPHLAEWDRNVQAKLQEVHGAYEPYKKFKDANLDPSMLEKSLFLWNEFQQHPEEVIAQAIEAYQLPYVNENEISNLNNGDDDDIDYGDDITKHPQFQQLAQQLEQVQTGLTERQQAEQTAQAVREHEQWLDQIEKDKGPVDRLYVTALMTQGIDGDTAVQKYQELVANAAGSQITDQTQQTQQNNQQTQDVPVVLGNEGQSGSGVADTSIDFGKMSDGKVQDAVVAMLEAQRDNNNQG